MELTKTEQKKLDEYPKINISQKEFDALPEYSLTNPTQSGSIGIKKWKRKTPFTAKDEDAIWFIGTIEKEMYVFHHAIIEPPTN